MGTGERVHSICVVKNEADIIEACIKAALAWSDRIVIYDGDSTDGTWQKVMAMKSERVIPWKQDGKVFQESLRAEAFHAFRGGATGGDWWCHLDADEFYIDEPKQFLRKVPRSYHVVWGLFIEYYLTESDVASIDFSQSVERVLPQLRHYRAMNSEPRFFRHRDRLQWSRNEGWPRHMGRAWPDRIRFRHFKYRSPQQIERRLITRQDNRSRGFPGWQNSLHRTWRDALADPSSTHVDRGDGQFIVDCDRLPNHLGTWKSRVAKWIMHGLNIWP